MIYEDIRDINEWSLIKLKSAMTYYQSQLLKPHDDNEHNWYLNTITKCQRLIEKATNTQSEWEGLFQ